MRASTRLVSALRRTLFETSVWCARRLRVDDPANSLRTESLLPPTLDRTRLPLLTKQQWVAVVDEVASRRAERLAQLTGGAPLVLTEGRLLACDPGMSISDGASELESKGFIDAEDLPGWDTWVAFVTDGRDASRRPGTGGWLVAWVPIEFAESVERAIEVNAVEGVRWLDDVDRNLSNELIRGS